MSTDPSNYPQPPNSFAAPAPQNVVVLPAISTHLPENAYRELKPGETYLPMVPADALVPEVTRRSIIFGIVMNIIFSASATYLALKVGQGIETAIPISILAVGFSGFVLRTGRRASSLLENVNILAISTTSGIVAGGTVFTMPAIYLLGLQTKLELSNFQLFFTIFLVPFLGAVLGVIFLIPFRNYFVKLMHGKLPFPEATATNEILATGAGSGGSQAWVLIYSFFIAFVYNFLIGGMKLFNEKFTTGVELIEGHRVHAFRNLHERVPSLGWLETRLADLTDRVKAIFEMGINAAFIGLGFIIGLRYATIICCGSFLSYFVIVPLFSGFDLDGVRVLNAGVSGTSHKELFEGIPKIIGIGGIFTAGLLSIVKMSGVIFTALTQALGSLFRSSGKGRIVERTEQDIGYGMLMLLGLATTAALFTYFRFVVLVDMPGPTRLAAIATGLALVLSFLFTTVSAWAIAMISTTPLSGMTVTTIIITAAVLLASGLPKGDAGMLATLLVGGVVCTALSMSGTMVTQFKIAYWIGATPRKIQWAGILSALLASGLVTATIMVLAYKPGYAGAPTLTPATQSAADSATQPAAPIPPLEAPQANMMKVTLESFVGTEGQVPWKLYGAGAVLALIVNFLGISPLAFMLGMYLPMSINTPILLGAFVAAMVSRGKDERRTKARNDKGVLVASGLIAGAAIFDVTLNALSIFDEKFASNKIMATLEHWGRQVYANVHHESTLWQTRNFMSLGVVLLLCLFVYIDCRRAKPADRIV
ncbi:MAG TPA: OPT/YSL family transporter [Phycisphaerae bacterium]|nr:OPT/YSL family transporter [Phycisphaerae bacterium]